MKPAICKKHGPQRFTLTSPLLAKAISEDGLDNIFITRIRIYSNERWSEYFVDNEYLTRFLPNHSGGEAVFKDRDVAKRRLNDRLLIMKVLSGMEYACPVCLSEIPGAVS
ncbi:hypothetical protein [Paraburkholderia bannensis]|uniref:hypothetical protein n=1 Tax=Paraburkholderia bannensis TaxID=765414 RepID=UPI002AB021F5|nr:hypothetical protein [Paraburkholderia bannensis]